MNNILRVLRLDKYDKSNSFLNLVRDLFLTTFIGGIASFLSYVFNFIAANKLPEDSFSTFSGVVGVIYLIQIPSLTLQTYFTNLVAKDEHFFKKNNFTIFAKKTYIISVLGVLLVLIASPVISAYMDIPLKYFMITALMVFGFIYSPVMRGILLGLKKIDLFNILGLLEAFLKLLIFLIALNVTSDPSWVIVAFSLPALLVGIVAHLVVQKTPGVMDAGKEVAGRFLVNARYLMITIFTFLFYSAPFSIGVMLIRHENRASYAALALLGKIVYFASVMASSVLFRYFSGITDRRTKNKYLYLGVAMNIAISLSIVIVYIFFTEPIVEAMFAGKYTEMIPLVAPLALGMVFYSTAFSFVNLFLSDHKIVQVYLLGFATLVQIILYSIFNETLNDAVMNQVITFILIFVLMSVYWSMDQFKAQKLK